MPATAAYNLLRADLGLPADAVPADVEALLGNKLSAARAELLDAGIVIDDSQPHDLELLVMYAAWLYRGRVQQTAKPLMLQRLLRNRQAALATEADA